MIVCVYFREDYDEVCEGLIDEFCDLERHVNMAVLHLIVLTFCQTTETLDKLVQTAMQQAVCMEYSCTKYTDYIEI